MIEKALRAAVPPPATGDQEWDWMLAFFGHLRACYSAAAAHGEGMLVAFV